MYNSSNLRMLDITPVWTFSQRDNVISKIRNSFKFAKLSGSDVTLILLELEFQVC
ncbi:hypothetical protein RND71_016348 [Anisodus tanguticus]|uniref:Uncharacterized protein n=1 Tax=Anisodus tanguticus TaxID=243964 RepID=A0AAE1VM36_9SOLA|nr:hypothetical protein RND71_016348 [Anisodus tanguticus]